MNSILASVSAVLALVTSLALGANDQTLNVRDYGARGNGKANGTRGCKEDHSGFAHDQIEMLAGERRE